MSAQINDGGPAFARSATKGTSGIIIRDAQTGMSLRDYFAGQALAGLLADSNASSRSVYATDAYDLADAMLAARNLNKETK